MGKTYLYIFHRLISVFSAGDCSISTFGPVHEILVIIAHAIGGSRKGGLTTFLVLNVFHHERAVRISVEKQLDPDGPIASRRGSVLEFQYNP